MDVEVKVVDCDDIPEAFDYALKPDGNTRVAPYQDRSPPDHSDLTPVRQPVGLYPRSKSGLLIQQTMRHNDN